MLHRLSRYLVGALLIVVVCVAAAVWWLWHGGLPRRQGTATIDGLGNEVTVRFSAVGVPHISGRSLADVAAAVGYVQANDRMVQLELGRRLAAGRLAEVLGDVALPSDRYYRSLGFPRWARLQQTAMGTETRAAMEAYARGVNSWLRERGGDLPPELRILGIRPQPWTPLDSTYFLLQMGHQLSYWQGRPEENRLRWLAAVGPQRLGQLLGLPHLDVPAQTLSVATALPAPAEPAAALSRPGGPAPGWALGSNNWILGGAWTASGSPLLANDPHLPLPLPGLWYQMQIRSPEYEAVGVTLPGFPFVVIGQGPDIAWGLTNVMLDDHDLFLERLSDDGSSVQRGDGWLRLEVTEERIERAGATAEIQTVRYTDRGVLLEADPGRSLPARSLAWTGSEPADPASVLLRLARAHTVDELIGNLEAYGGPAQNLVAVDRGGDLLYTAIGRAPARRRGDGRLPAPGWDDSYGWEGLQPQSANPTSLRPPSGIFVSANNDLGLQPGRGATAPFSADYLSSHRADRIRELLRQRRDWTPAAIASVQTDIVSSYALEVVSLIADRYVGDADAAFELLEHWDGAMAPSGAAALFAIFDRRLRDAVFGDDARSLGLDPLGWDLSQPHAGDPLLRLLHGDMTSEWFDDVTTGAVEHRHQILQRTLAAAWAECRRRWGDTAANWSYGQMHTLTFESPLGTVPVVGRWLNRGPFPMPGSPTTIAAFGGRWHGATLPVSYGPSMRWIADPVNPDASLLVLPAGESGHPADPHYDDQIQPYLAGEMRSVHWSPAAIESATRSLLTLRPSR